jgi:drug/metabolite transporter (DMT)-like permease
MGIFLLIVGAVVISYNKNFTFNLGILYGLLAGLGWGIVFFLFQYPVALVGPLLASLFVEVGVAVIACLHILYDRKNIQVDTIVSEAPPLFILFLSFCAMVGSLCFMLSAEAIGVAYTSALGALSPIVGGLVGILYFKESITLQKIMALLCTAVGISLIALS